MPIQRFSLPMGIVQNVGANIVGPMFINFILLKIWRKSKKMKDFILKTLVKIIERFEDANKAWLLNHTFFQLPFWVCVEAYIRILIRGVKK